MGQRGLCVVHRAVVGGHSVAAVALRVEFRNVCAGHKGALALPTQHDHAHLGVDLQLRQSGGQLPPHGQ